MKTVTIVAIAVMLAGIYMAYQKDSSFASTDTGSLLIGAGAGVIIGSMVG